MADEVIIYEIATYDESGSPLFGRPITTQVLDTAQASAKLNPQTEVIRIKSNATVLWYKFGASDVSAAANTDGNLFLPANGYEDFYVGKNSGLYIDTAADS